MARRRGHPEAQILAAVRQAESGTRPEESVARWASSSRQSTCGSVSVRGLG